MPLLPEEALEIYDIDTVDTTNGLSPDNRGGSLSSMLLKQDASRRQLFIIADRLDLPVFSSSDFINLHIDKDDSSLRLAIETSRVVKDDFEISLIRHANIVSSYAHTQILQSAQLAKN